MKAHRLHWIDVVATLVLSALAIAIGVECYRRGISGGTLGLGAMALALFVGLGRPWRFRETWGQSNVLALTIASVGLLVGLASDLLLPISVAWTALLWAWLSGRLEERARPRIFRLLLLTLFVFPWVDVDVKPVSWAMRVSSAAASQPVLTLFGLDTVREGTLLYVGGQPVEITESCDGGETLHAMLVVGLAAAYVYLGRRRRIWPWLPVLCGFAWLANTLRVLQICVAAAWFPDGWQMTWIHDGGGWLLVALMMVLCVACFASWNRLSYSLRSLRRHRPLGWWNGVKRWRHEGTAGQVALWSLLLACVGLGLLWRAFPLPDAQQRLGLLPQVVQGQTSRQVALTDSEQRRLGAAQSVKRIYRCGDREYLVTAIDGSANRRAVHDPMYCWTITGSSDQPLHGGSGTVLRVVEQGIEKEVLFWFSDGNARHASPARYLLHTSLRRASLGWWGDEPVLVLIEPLQAAPVNWFRVLDECPWLMQL